MLRCGKPQPCSPACPSPPSPSLPLAPQVIALLNAEMHPGAFLVRSEPLFIPSSFIGDPCGTQRFWLWYLKLPNKAFSSPKQSMTTQKKPGLLGIVARLSGKPRLCSGHSTTVVEDLPHPAVSIYMGVLPDLLKSGPYCFLIWLTHFSGN